MEKIRNRKEFINNETDWLYSLVNDKDWREEMWISKGCKNKAMLYKPFYTTQKIIIEHLLNCYYSQSDLYANCVKDLIHNKKQLRNVAKQIINNL